LTEIHSPDIFEQKRRRNFFILASSFGMILILVFSIIDYLEGDFLEFFINIFMAGILIFGAIGIFKFSMDRIVYTIGLNLLNLAILYNVSIGAGGGMVAILWLYIMPLLIFFFLETTESIVSTILFFFGAIILMVYPSLFGTFDYGTGMGIRFLVSLLFLTIIANGLESSRYRYSTLLKISNNELIVHKEKLEKSMFEIKTLSGLLPICSHCKKIRDDKGYWNILEGYIQEHSDATFSHGMCPECSDELYGKEDWYIEMKNEEKQKK
jgi:hypothetical protein